MPAMSPIETRATFSLASLFALRMLGLFMILPVFAIYGTELEGASELLIGLAIGAYGLTQAMLQVPFGLASDRFGRKPVIIAGLVIFCLGSLLAALSDNIYGVIAGRALQGAGAIASAVMALLSDLTTDENRTKAMATVGASIGVSFSIALVLGPIVAGWFGVSGLFWMTAVLALAGILVVIWVVPTPIAKRKHRDSRPVLGEFSDAFKNFELLRLDFGVFLLHMTLTASFVVVPVVLVDRLQIANVDHWQLYLPVMVISFILMIPLMIVAEAKRKIREVFLLAIVLLGSALLGLAIWHQALWQMVIGLLVFFWAFNLLEAMLPSLVSKIAPAGSKGTSMGVYSGSQFFGAFVGGVGGGYLHGAFGPYQVFMVCGLLAFIWLIVAYGMKQPRFLQSYRFDITQHSQEDTEELLDRLLAVEGVEEAVVIMEERAAYLKVDRKRFDQAVLVETMQPMSA